MRDYKDEISEYLDEVKNRKQDNLDKILNAIKDLKYVCIFGAGMTSQTLIALWRSRIDKNIDFLCDNDQNKWGQKFHGDIVCISPDDLKKYGNDVAIIIATRFIKEIYLQLKEIGFNNVFYLGDYRLANSKYLRDKKNIDIVKNNVLKMVDILEDKKSKEVLLNLIKIWFDYHVEDLEYSSIYTDDAYYPVDIVKLQKNESYVDAGAYNGDTINKFLQEVNYSFDSIFAFELDKDNFKELELNTSKLDQSIGCKIKLYNVGVFDEEKSIFYERGIDKGADSRIGVGDQRLNQAKTVRLSDVLNGKRVSFIKMDVEGAEINALCGAEDLIKKNKPALAICVYHELEHLWEIPFYIKKMNSDYKLYLRHHSNLEFETVCYAIDTKG